MMALLVEAWRKWGVEVLRWIVVYGISAHGVGGGVSGGRKGWRGVRVFGECQLSGQSGAVGARVAGLFVWIIQCDTRETKAD